MNRVTVQKGRVGSLWHYVIVGLREETVKAGKANRTYGPDLGSFTRKGAHATRTGKWTGECVEIGTCDGTEPAERALIEGYFGRKIMALHSSLASGRKNNHVAPFGMVYVTFLPEVKTTTEKALTMPGEKAMKTARTPKAIEPAKIRERTPEETQALASMAGRVEAAQKRLQCTGQSIREIMESTRK